ncbi:unnamed protein product [Aureobasidium vineae]|uniref:Cryptic loci regulator 2 N-terminal domain-containing protein n=1 Tax=Aureobasidium vineae TaxID=2773715 RepID=A0A9N8JTV3_9PEZI|nr:unnamed protein product [Aureobasidium vineae]
MAAFHPTIGALRLPAACPSPVQAIDLDLLPSDGDAAFRHHNDPLFAVIDPDTVATDFRAAISRQADLQVLFGGISFAIRDLPAGYQAEHRVYAARRELRIYGHPSSQYFKSWATWGVHLTSLLKEDLQHCACVLCAVWRHRAPANAAVNVGLPLVPGGAVGAALAATVAREVQRAREQVAQEECVGFLARAAEVGDLAEWQRRVVHEALEKIVGGDGVCR